MPPRLPPPFLLLLLLLLLFLQPTAAASRSSFCKCTCLTNSTIIPLSPTQSCADCNRQFCLDYNLPICKQAKEEEVVTVCFQRDSVKDRVVVFIFIVATAGLLVWALARPWVERWVSRARATARERGGGDGGGGYEPVGR